MGEDQTQRLDFLMENEEPTLSTEPVVVSTVTKFKRHSDRKSPHYVTALVSIAGIIMVWLYSSGKSVLAVSNWTGLVHVATVNSAFASPVQIAVISVIALTAAIWVAVRRRASRFPFPI